MPGAETGRVRVAAAEDGTVRVSVVRGGGSGTPGSAPGRAVLDVAGALLTWPVLAPPGLPDAEIHDPGRAQQWLWAVYGEDVAGAVESAATTGWAGHAGPTGADGSTEADGSTGAGPTDGADAAVEVPVGSLGAGRDETLARAAERDGALARAAGRLAFGHWAARWWPASYLDGIPALEPDLLGLELAALTHTCQQLFDDVEDQPDADAAELIDVHADALGPLLRWWRSAPPGSATAGRLDAVLRLIDDAADGAGLDGEAVRALRAALESRGTAGEPLEPAPAAGVGGLFARGRDYALAAGELRSAGGRLIARGTGTNDWRRYPPGFVDAAEHAVTWTASAVGAERRIEVDVVADGSAPATDVRLAAEVDVNGRPAHRVLLARRDDLWTGRAEVDLPDGGTPRVEVGVLMPGFDPGPGHGPGQGPEREPSTRADRDAVRALARRRLAEAEGAGAEQVSGRALEGTGEWASEGTGEDHEPFLPFLAEIAAAASAEEDF
ncbi:hypothetical protein [Streptomyces sp. NPDC101249]|uniref:hypothetical protein n=1 Tax=Streptomyces sp. NPDC101249 TaxID=3366140 RepID=UPI00380EE5A3